MKKGVKRAGRFVKRLGSLAVRQALKHFMRIFKRYIRRHVNDLFPKPRNLQELVTLYNPTALDDRLRRKFRSILKVIGIPRSIRRFIPPSVLMGPAGAPAKMALKMMAKKVLKKLLKKYGKKVAKRAMMRYGKKYSRRVALS